jgi:hypothetical protein
LLKCRRRSFAGHYFGPNRDFGIARRLFDKVKRLAGP